MTFVQAIAVCLTRGYVDFSGRASRSEFWWFLLFNLLATAVAISIHQVLGMLVVLALQLPSIAVSMRRLHDVGRRGWWLPVMYLGPLAVVLMLGAQVPWIARTVQPDLVPLIGFALLLYWNVQPSRPVENAWGAPAG